MFSGGLVFLKLPSLESLVFSDVLQCSGNIQDKKYSFVNDILQFAIDSNTKSIVLIRASLDFHEFPLNSYDFAREINRKP